MEEKNKIEEGTEEDNKLKKERNIIKELLEENLEYTEEIYKMVKKIRRQMLWQRVTGIIYLILILAPIFLAIIYLPSLLKQFLSTYGGLLPSGQRGVLQLLGNKEGSGGLGDILSNQTGGIPWEEITKQLKK